MGELSRRDAIQIIQHIKRGTPPPPRLISHIHVGRQRWIEGMEWYLDMAKEVDLSAVRFIVGEYGSGKTHFLHMTAHLALQRHFVVCEVTLSRDIRLDRFDTVWREMIGRLSTPESEGEPEGIESILNRWCQGIQEAEQLQSALIGLDKISHLDPDFRKAIRGYLRAYVQEEDRDSYLQWLKGDPIRPEGVRTRIDRASARAMLRSIIQFLKYLGYNGLVLFLDELELIRNLDYRIRDANYDTLRQFIDGSDNLQNFLLLCSLTPIMQTDYNKGIPSYSALWARIGGMLGEVRGDYRSITVNLESPDAQISDEDFLELAKRLRKIHAIAEAWDATEMIPDTMLKYLVEGAKREAGETSLPRLITQATVTLLEAKKQNPNREPDELLPEAIRRSAEMIRQQERERSRPW